MSTGFLLCVADQLTDCRDDKQQQRANRFSSLHPTYHAPFTDFDKSIIDKPIGDLVAGVRKDSSLALDILRTYGKVAVKAHERTNCVTELLLPEAERWQAEEVNFDGPLAGVPVSLKDTVIVKGFDSSVGYTKFCRSPEAEDGPMVKLLKDAGKLY